MRCLLILPVALAATLAGAATRFVQDQCGPFTDVSALFCPYVLEAYYTGITVGTSPTTFSPDMPMTRGQAAVFVTKGLNQALARGSRRAALGQWWTTTPQYANGLGSTTVGNYPRHVAFDGADLWVANGGGPNSVSRVRASDGKVLETWTNWTGSNGVLVAMGRVFVTGDGQPGQNTGGLYMIDPSQSAGSVTEVADNLGVVPLGIAFDGSRIWTADYGGRSVSIVTPGSTFPWAVTTVKGFSLPEGILFDGTNVWVSDFGAGTLLRLDAAGNVQQTVAVGSHPLYPVFDGTNIWVPVNGTNSVSIVRASTGVVVANLTGNGLASPYSAAFDGERVLVTNATPPGFSLWKAADLTPIGTMSTGSIPWGACSDGLNFWITTGEALGQLWRF